MPAPEVYYDMAAKALDVQIQQIDQLDSKVSSAFAAASGILAVFAALATLAALPAHGWVHYVVLGLLGVAAVCYVLLTLKLLRAFKVSDWTYGPKMSRVKEHSENYEASGMRDWLADIYSESIRRNEAEIAAKSDRLNFGLHCLAIESFVLLAAIAVSLLFT